MPYLLLVLLALVSPDYAARAWAVNNLGRHARPADAFGFPLADAEPVPFLPVDEPIPYQLAEAIAALTPRRGATP